MNFEKKLWRWYKRHDSVIQAVLEIAADVVPAGRMVIGALRAVSAVLDDQSERVDERKMEEVQSLLRDVKPIIMDVVDEIEDLRELEEARSVEDVRRVT